MFKKVWVRSAAALLVFTSVAGCQVQEQYGALRTAQHVDLQRFMGDWYVIGNIPTPIETQAYNAVESYALNTDGSIDTQFTFNQAGFDGQRKVYNPTGYVRDPASNAVWGMQFIWPFKAEYRIVYVDSAYQQAVIGRSKRDYVWIMARQPDLAAADYAALVSLVGAQGYDVDKIRKVPHRLQQNR